MTLAGGGLFGFLLGTVAVSFASTIGATLACAVSRFLLRDWVQNRFSSRLEKINTGIEQEGAFYLFSLRLVPVFPFFVINLAMGPTRMRLFTFFWVSQLGMLPGTMVYVNAGREPARIDSLSGIMSPGVLISFAILGLFPITAKKLLAWYTRKFKPAAAQDEIHGSENKEMKSRPWKLPGPARPPGLLPRDIRHWAAISCMAGKRQRICSPKTIRTWSCFLGPPMLLLMSRTHSTAWLSMEKRRRSIRPGGAPGLPPGMRSAAARVKKRSWSLS